MRPYIYRLFVYLFKEGEIFYDNNYYQKFNNYRHFVYFFKLK
jgi:hypothetical protein